MESSSPTKRRVLGALDPNANSPRTPQHLGTKQVMKMDPVASRSPSRPQTLSLPSPPRQEEQELPRKRPIPEMAPPTEDQDQAEPAKKRPCLRDEPEEDVSRSQESPVSPLRHGSASPEASSLFDNSIVDTSHATAITEPDEQQQQQQPGANPLYAAAAAAVAASAPVRRRAGTRLTREEAREKAEIIRLRLGLATYKVRTGQTDVPLEQLEVRPMLLPRSNTTSSRLGVGVGATSSRHALPSAALFAQRQAEQQMQANEYHDARRPLPSGLAISAFGAMERGVGLGVDAGGRLQQQQQTEGVVAGAGPIEQGAHGQNQGQEQEEPVQAQSVQQGVEAVAEEQDTHKSSPPVQSARLDHADTETEELPRLPPPGPGPEQGQGQDGELDVLPTAADGLLSLSRG